MSFFPKKGGTISDPAASYRKGTNIISVFELDPCLSRPGSNSIAGKYVVGPSLGPERLTLANFYSPLLDICLTELVKVQARALPEAEPPRRWLNNGKV